MGGSSVPLGTGFIAIYSTANAFAALKEDGSIEVWGDPTLGGSGAPSGTGFTGAPSGTGFTLFNSFTSHNSENRNISAYM